MPHGGDDSGVDFSISILLREISGQTPVSEFAIIPFTIYDVIDASFFLLAEKYFNMTSVI